VATVWSQRRWKAVALFLGVATLGAASDLLSKHWAFSTLIDRDALAPRVRQYLDTPPTAEQQRPTYARAVLQTLDLQRDLLPGVRITLSTNPGVVFGFDAIPRWVVNLITIGMIGVIVAVLLFSQPRAWGIHLGLGLILGGAVGNLYDRLFASVRLPHLPPIENHVRDFIDCSGLGYPWIFNLADAWLVIGVALVGIGSFRRSADKEKPA
jgi:lipoprotein signal peptidase